MVEYNTTVSCESHQNNSPLWLFLRDCYLRESSDSLDNFSSRSVTEEEYVDPEYLEQLRKKLSTYRMRRLASPFPKIVKTDIRKHFMNMYINALNTSDNLFLESFLRTYCIPNCLFKIAAHRISFSAPFDRDLLTINMCGIENIISIYSFMHKYPDFCFHFSNLQIKQRLDLNSVQLIADFNGHGTATNKPSLPWLQMTSPNVFCIENNIDHHFHLYMSYVSDIYFHGKLSIYIDSNGYICGLLLL